ncbi:PHD finger protein 14-like isoform X2 [Mytilus trossulus]|uniref:PHD finger protein 14-like isoform X2 n=1 Tax=Mytilus trossulus TaxID=6551 RepID=UPI0030070E0A
MPLCHYYNVCRCVSRVYNLRLNQLKFEGIKILGRHATMSTVKEKQFLKLLIFSEQISWKVVRSFIKSNILINFDNSFVKFLDFHKHSIYHLWRNSVACCECEHSAFVRKTDRCLKEEEIKELFKVGQNMTPEHFIVIGNTVKQNCICDVRINDRCSLDKLDIMLAYTLIKNCGSLRPAEDTWLRTVNDIVYRLNHEESLSSVDQETLDRWWTMIEGSVLGLASKVQPTCFEESVNTSIDLLKISNFDVKCVKDMVDKIKDEKCLSIRKQLGRIGTDIFTNNSPHQVGAVKEEMNEDLQQDKDIKTERQSIKTECTSSLTDDNCLNECPLCHNTVCCNMCEENLEKIKNMENQHENNCELIQALKRQEEKSRQKIAELEQKCEANNEKLKTLEKQSGVGRKQEEKSRQKIKDLENKCEANNNKIVTLEKQSDMEKEKIRTMANYRNQKRSVIRKCFDRFEEARREYDTMEEQEEHAYEGHEVQEIQDAKKVDDNAVCDVCKDIVEEENNEMIFCDGCNLCVHQACYGVQVIPEGNWYCKTCVAAVKPKCALCPYDGGAMKRTSDGTQWAHVTCAWWIPGVTIGNPKEMEPIVGIDKLPEERLSLICSLCKIKDGACIQCSFKNCSKPFHVTCAYLNGLRMDYPAEDDTDIKFEAYCKTHSNQVKTPKKKRRREYNAQNRPNRKETMRQTITSTRENPDSLTGISEVLIEEQPIASVPNLEGANNGISWKTIHGTKKLKLSY